MKTSHFSFEITFEKRKKKVKDQNIFLVNFQVFLTQNITFSDILSREFPEKKHEF